MAKIINLPDSEPVNQGEILVIQYLKEKLPDTYSLIPNVEILQPGKPPYEYDLIVVAPHAIYVIEIKRWLGGIEGDDYAWLVAGEHRRQNPYGTTNNKARILKSTIENKQPSIGRFWVEALVVIADDQGELSLRGNYANRVFQYLDLPAFITDRTRLGGKDNDLRPVRAYIEKAIEEAARGKQSGPLRFGDYEVLETLSRRDKVSEYLARNTLLRGEGTVRLRAFSYNPYLSSDELERSRESIRREAEALQKIGTHPNLISLKGYFTSPEDPNLFIEITDWSTEGTLRGLMSISAPMTLERKIELAYGIAAGLKAAHDAEVIHRDIRPENILIGRDKQPRLMNFDFARLAVTGAQTVGPVQHDPDVPRNYMAPELLNPTLDPTPATDIFGLGSILFEMLVGQTLFDSPEEALQEDTAVGSPASFNELNIPPQLNQLVRQMIHPKLEKRPQSIDEVLSVLKDALEKPSSTLTGDEPEPAPSPIPNVEQEPAVFAVNAIIDDKYQVQKVLEAGGSGRVYKVFDGVFEQVYALKLFENTNLSLDNLKTEVKSLRDIDHPNIVKVITWGKLSGSSRLYLVSEFVDGEDLAGYTKPDRRLSVRESVQAILDVLNALSVIHPNVDRIQALRKRLNEGEATQEEYYEFQELQNEGLLHRDIKPANLMFTKEGVKLIDFNIAAKAREAGATWVGTPGYMLPETGISTWEADADLFATGIVLYELITGHHPYPDRKPNASDEPLDPKTYIPDLHPNLAEILLRATSCNSDIRYKSANKFKEDLLALDGLYLQAVSKDISDFQLSLEPWEINKANYNPYVTRFLKLYSQAARDNSGTRGLDDIARLTYVETRLDCMLRPAVLDGHFKLVIITGNAGDGKTAFIQSMENIVSEEGGLVEKITDNSSRFTYRGIQFLTNYDGSQDEGQDRANDDVLSEFFAPFNDDQFDELPNQQVYIIAINEGRLIDFFNDDVGKMSFTQLGNLIERFFDPNYHETNLPDWAQIIDLNQRSVVALDEDFENQSIFERQINKLLTPEFWESCQACALKENCFIKFNVDTLADPTSGPMAQERIRTLFEIVHLRRQLHITMRDMRSAISWMLFQDHDCDAVADLIQGGNSNEEQLTHFYFNAYAFNGNLPEGRADDRLVRLLRQIDPAQVANPATDRTLHFHEMAKVQLFSFDNRSHLAEELFASWRLPTGWQASQEAAVADKLLIKHQIQRRQTYFERRGENWKRMLPYRTLFKFKEYIETQTEVSHSELRDMLVEGISLAEGARHRTLSKENICLKAGQDVKGSLKSFRLFPLEDFSIKVPPTKNQQYLEYTPDRVIFYHKPKDPTLRIRSARPAELVLSLDLFELLDQIRNGYIPSPNDLEGFFLNLVIFKNALAHLPFRRVLLTRDDQLFYEVIQNKDATIEIAQWSPDRMVAS